jgi:hypothetical protein
VEWEELRLARSQKDGYAPTTAPILDLLAEALAKRADDPRPAIVWIQDRKDEETIADISDRFAPEWIGVALGRFHCLRAWTHTLPDPRLKEDFFERGPVLYFLAPDGEVVATVEGRRALSKSTVSRGVRKLWGMAYEVNLRTYLGLMDRVLEAREDVARAQAALARKREAAEGNARKLAAVKKLEAEIEKKSAEIAAGEQSVLARCRLRPRYESLKPPDEATETAGSD